MIKPETHSHGVPAVAGTEIVIATVDGIERTPVVAWVLRFARGSLTAEVLPCTAAGPFTPTEWSWCGVRLPNDKVIVPSGPRSGVIVDYDDWLSDVTGKMHAWTARHGRSLSELRPEGTA